MNERFALITDAGSEIGRALAIEFARIGYHVLLVALPGTGLTRLKKEIELTYSVKCDYLEQDLLMENGPQKVYEWTKKNHYTTSILVNNLGMDSASPLVNNSPESNSLAPANMMKLNMLLPALLTRLFLPDMKKLDSAYILNISRLISQLPPSCKLFYSASVKFIGSFSAALRQELKNTPVQVSLALPGTAISDERMPNEFKSKPGMVRKLLYPNPEQVAGHSVRRLFKGKFRVTSGRFSNICCVVLKLMPGSVRW